MSVLFGIANLWCEIILVNDQHKTDRGQYFSVAINPPFTAIEVEGGDPINLSAVLIGCASLHGQPGRRSILRLPVTPEAQLGLPGCTLLLPNPGTTGKPKPLGQLRAVHQITSGWVGFGEAALGCTSWECAATAWML